MRKRSGRRWWSLRSGCPQLALEGPSLTTNSIAWGSSLEMQRPGLLKQSLRPQQVPRRGGCASELEKGRPLPHIVQMASTLGRLTCWRRQVHAVVAGLCTGWLIAAAWRPGCREPGCSGHRLLQLEVGPLQRPKQTNYPPERTFSNKGPDPVAVFQAL